jgi:hypothetical protein
MNEGWPWPIQHILFLIRCSICQRLSCYVRKVNGSQIPFIFNLYDIGGGILTDIGDVRDIFV